MEKINDVQAGKLIKEAYKLKREHPELRTGQALWHLLPDNIAVMRLGTGADFFFDEDDLVVFDKFFSYFVEENDIEE